MNMHYPFIPNPIPYPPNNIEEEIIKLKQEINKLKERISLLEQQPKTDYLKKDDDLYMIWTFTRSFFVA